MEENLASEVQELARRLGIVEDVLTSLVEEHEASAGARPIAPAPQTPVWTPTPVTTASPANSASASSASVMRARISKPVSPVNWLGAVSVICFVFAAVFIIKLAIDTGWLTPARQIGLAAVFGMTLIGAGLQMAKVDRGYASLLPGAGILVLYLTTLAAHSYHHLIGFEIALAFIALVSAMCIWLYTIMKHEVYPITAALGAYVLPFLLGDQTQIDFILYYHVACSISFATISVWLESRLLSLVAAYLAIGVSFAASQTTPFDATYIWVLALHFSIFTFATVLHSVVHKKALKAQEAWSYLPVLLVFYTAEYALIDKMHPGVAPYVSLAFAAVLVVFYFIGRQALQGEALESTSVVSTYAAIVLFHSLYLELLPDDVKPWLLPVIAIAAAFAPRTNTKPHFGPLLALGLIVLIEYFRTLFSLLDGNASSNTIASAFTATAALALLFWNQRKSRKSTELIPLLFAAHGLAILAFYNIAKPIGSLAVSITWLGYSMIVMGAGFKIRDKVVAKSALGTLGLAAAKALLYDAAQAAAPVRIGCLLLTGLVLYGCGFLLKQIETWES